MVIRTDRRVEVGDLDLSLCVLEFQKWRWDVLCSYRLFDYSVLFLSICGTFQWCTLVCLKL
jgi:hypothetical protein